MFNVIHIRAIILGRKNRFLTFIKKSKKDTLTKIQAYVAWSGTYKEGCPTRSSLRLPMLLIIVLQQQRAIFVLVMTRVWKWSQCEREASGKILLFAHKLHLARLRLVYRKTFSKSLITCNHIAKKTVDVFAVD